MATDYLGAEAALAEAERLAWGQRDFDTLSRLYMPLQETRRQIRQRCAEGVVRLDLVATAGVALEPQRIVEEHPHGQLLVAGFETIAPALEVRRLAKERGLFLETFLGAAYSTDQGVVIVLIGESSTPPPPTGRRSMDELGRYLVIRERDLARGRRMGTPETYAEVMALWEQLHAPYLAAADVVGDPIKRIELYRRTIEVDRACELAHQKLSGTAAQMLKKR